MHVTLGTTLGVIAPTVLRSFAAFRARGSVDMRRRQAHGARGFSSASTLGVVIADNASSVALRWIWVVFGTALATKMALGRDDWQIADTLPRPPWLESAAFIIGRHLDPDGNRRRDIHRAAADAPRPAAAAGRRHRDRHRPDHRDPGIIGYIISGWGEPGLPPLSLGYVNLGACLIVPLERLAAPYGVEGRRTACLETHARTGVRRLHSPASSRGSFGRSLALQLRGRGA